MRIIRLMNGDMEFISHDDELVEVVEKYMGYDMSCAIEELVGKADEVKYRTESDLLSYELGLEESRNGYIEVRDLLDQMSSALEKTKINKTLLLELIDKMENVINKYI